MVAVDRQRKSIMQTLLAIGEKVFVWSIIIRLFDFGPLRHRVDRQKYPMSNFVFHRPGQQTKWVFDLAQLLKVTMTPNESF